MSATCRIRHGAQVTPGPKRRICDTWSEGRAELAKIRPPYGLCGNGRFPICCGGGRRIWIIGGAPNTFGRTTGRKRRERVSKCPLLAGRRNLTTKCGRRPATKELRRATSDRRVSPTVIGNSRIGSSQLHSEAGWAAWAAEKLFKVREDATGTASDREIPVGYDLAGWEFPPSVKLPAWPRRSFHKPTAFQRWQGEAFERLRAQLGGGGYYLPAEANRESPFLTVD